MNRIVNIEDIIESLYETYGDSHAFDIVFTLEGTTYTVLSNADFLNELATNYYEMSYLTHKAKEQDINEFVNMWQLYTLRHNDEWSYLFNCEHETIDPLNNYYETRTYTPNITTANTGSYGRTSANSGGTSSTINHGKNTVGQTNTYDGVLRDSAKTTEGGNTTTTNTDSTVNKTNGVETSKSHTTGTTTETKTGYNTNPYDNMKKGAEFVARFNLREMIISGFTKECLFYDNGNGGGYEWLLPLI